MVSHHTLFASFSAMYPSIMACRSGRRRTSQRVSFRANSFVARHLMSQERLPFTATYFGSIALTLYFAVGVSRPCALYTREVVKSFCGLEVRRFSAHGSFAFTSPSR